MLLGVALGAAAVVAGAIALWGGGGPSWLRTGSGGAQLVAEVQQLLGGIPQSGATLGNPAAPVTIDDYGDLQCPVCADLALSASFGELLAQDVRAGKVKIVYRSLETATRDPYTFETQQIAALAAARRTTSGTTPSSSTANRARRAPAT